MAGLQFYLDVLEAVLGPLMLVVAGVVFAAAPRSWANRSLAVFIFVEGLTFGGIGNGVGELLATRSEDAAVRAVGAAMFRSAVFAVFLLPSLYLWFTSCALDNPLTRPLRTVWGRVGLGLVALAGGAYFLAARPGVTDALLTVFPYLVVSSLYAMAAAAVSFLRAHGPAQKRAKNFLLAFALRDVAIAGIALGYWVGPGSVFQQQSSFWWSVVYSLFPFMVAVGVLRGQIVDLDQRVRLTIGRTLVVASMLTAYFLASELASSYFESRWGLLVGIASAALLAVAAKPLARVGSKAARVIVPLPSDEEAFYAEQVAIAAGDGSIGAKERKGLDNLARRLGLPASTARKIEASTLAPPQS